MHKKIWVLVANASVAKILKAESNEVLSEIEVFEHPESHMRNCDLVSDAPGYNTERTAGAPHYAQKTASPKLKEKDHFAVEIAEFLEKSFHENAFEHLYIVSSTQFCSLLHHHLKDDLKRVIKGEVHKDLTLMKFSDVRSHLPEVL